eukprot:3570866-Ditylum_brightwellii.AAC.1
MWRTSSRWLVLEGVSLPTCSMSAKWTWLRAFLHMRRKRSISDVTSVALISFVSHGGSRMVLWRASSVRGTALGPVVGGFALTLSSVS